MRTEGACLICGKSLIYFESGREMTCISCRKTYMTHASCEDGHYICDECHAKRGLESIMAYCQKSSSKNPIQMVQDMMENPYIYMHGNEHHVMVGAALITAYKNSGMKVDLDSALKEMQARGSKYPGGSCGFWGCCGAAVSTGMFFSIVTRTTPLSGKSWGLANQITADALKHIGELGGPRCCKRNSFTAIISAVTFMKANCGVNMELPEKIECRQSGENKQCLKQHCPYHIGK